MIIINNENALRIKCDDVSSIEEYQHLRYTLEKELDNANRLGKNGIGLAAPQIGIAKNIAIIRLPKTNLDLVNCKIEKKYDSCIFKDEGCLSFPGRIENTVRFQETYIINNMIEPYSFITTGFLSIAVQHELDHLNSTLFIDHIAPKEQIIKNKIRPNDKCNCGSNFKYKKCCGKKE